MDELLQDGAEQRIARTDGTTNGVGQDPECPLLIRDDGMLYPNVPTVRALPGFRPYRGDPNASDEDRLRYLQGMRPKTTFADSGSQVLDLATASKEELIAAALDEFGVEIAPDTHMNAVRSQVAKLAGIELKQGGIRVGAVKE